MSIPKSDKPADESTNPNRSIQNSQQDPQQYPHNCSGSDQNPFTGEALIHDYDIGYWARYSGKAYDPGESLEWSKGWMECDEELAPA